MSGGYRGPGEVPEGLGPTAVTIGKFDGVHRGHRALVERLRREADARGLAAVAVTFDRHPAALFAPEKAPIPLLGAEHRARLLRDAGADAVVELPFDRAFAAQTPEAFARDVLAGALNARMVLVGSDFRFGVRGSGDVDTLRRLADGHGFEVVVVDDVDGDGGRRVSSSWIRELLDAGRVEEAAELLGRPPSVRGRVVHGLQRGRDLGYPTANLSREIDGYLPADGVYATRNSIDGGAPIPAATSIGVNPTFGDLVERQLESHLIDTRIDLYEHGMEVFFVGYVRPMRKFADAAALAEQMRSDEREIRGRLGLD